MNSEVSKNNILIRNELKSHNMPLWKLSKLMGCSEMSITRMFRENLPEERQLEIVELIRNGGK